MATALSSQSLMTPIASRSSITWAVRVIVLLRNRLLWSSLSAEPSGEAKRGREGSSWFVRNLCSSSRQQDGDGDAGGLDVVVDGGAVGQAGATDYSASSCRIPIAGRLLGWRALAQSRCKIFVI